jgi:hypothetical protein
MGVAGAAENKSGHWGSLTLQWRLGFGTPRWRAMRAGTSGDKKVTCLKGT